MVKILPASIGTYRLVRRDELTTEQVRVLRAVGRERVQERLLLLLTQGKVPAAKVAKHYRQLMAEIGEDNRTESK